MTQEENCKRMQEEHCKRQGKGCKRLQGKPCEMIWGEGCETQEESYERLLEECSRRAQRENRDIWKIYEEHCERLDKESRKRKDG